MKKTEHPVQLPDSLITKWLEDIDIPQGLQYLQVPLSVQFQEAAEWGANAELEACRDWLFLNGYGEAATISKLIAARRPKPPSLKVQALERCNDYIDPDGIIRRALEALPND